MAGLVAGVLVAGRRRVGVAAGRRPPAGAAAAVAVEDPFERARDGGRAGCRSRARSRSAGSTAAPSTSEQLTVQSAGGSLLVAGRQPGHGRRRRRSGWSSTRTAAGTCCGRPPSAGPTRPDPGLKYQTTERRRAPGRRPADHRGRGPPARDRSCGSRSSSTGRPTCSSSASSSTRPGPSPAPVGFDVPRDRPDHRAAAVAGRRPADQAPEPVAAASLPSPGAGPGPAGRRLPPAGRVPAGRRGPGALQRRDLRPVGVRAAGPPRPPRPGRRRGDRCRWARPPAGATPGPGARWCCGRRGRRSTRWSATPPSTRCWPRPVTCRCRRRAKPSLLERLRSVARTLIQPLA